MTTLGRYELVARLEVGGMAELYVARTRGAGGFEKRFAIKRILPHLADDKRFRAMFVSEARITAMLAHANLCQVLELGDDAGELYLVMEYLDGAPWLQLARQLVPWPVAASVLAQACDGLHHAHAHGVVHRDVSPANLFVTTAGACKVIDFGIAKHEQISPDTSTGLLKGKHAYFSPEQLRGEPVDARTDVFAMGIVLWEAVAGRSLFNIGGGELDIFERILHGKVPELGNDVDDVLSRALAVDRAKRFASIDELGRAIRAIGRVADATEVADLVQARCATRLAERARQIASGTERLEAGASMPRRAVDDVASSSIGLRAASVRIAPPRRRWLGLVAVGGLAATAGVAWLALRDRAHVVTAPSDAGSTAAMFEAGVSAIDAGSRIAVVDAAVRAAPGDARSTTAAGDADASVRLADAGRRTAVVDAAVRVRVAADAQVAEPARDPGFYSIDSRPYATIFVDGVRVGDTPLFKIHLAAGHHQVRAVLQDGRDKTFDITITSGQVFSSGQLSW